MHIMPTPNLKHGYILTFNSWESVVEAESHILQSPALLESHSVLLRDVPIVTFTN